jgi:hypothetical protein
MNPTAKTRSHEEKMPMFTRNECVIGLLILCGVWMLAAAQKKEKPVKNALTRNPAAIQAGGQMFA